MKGKLINSNSVLLFMDSRIYYYVVYSTVFFSAKVFGREGSKHREINTKRKIQEPISPYYFISASIFCLLLLLQMTGLAIVPPPYGYMNSQCKKPGG